MNIPQSRGRAEGLADVIKSNSGHARATGMLSFILVILCRTSFLHTRIYADRMTLWTDTLAKNPNSPMAHLNMAAALKGIGNLDGAEKHYMVALQLQPDSPSILQQLGDLYVIRKDYPRAIEWYEKSAEHIPESPIPLLHQIRADPLFAIGSAYQNWADQLAEHHGAAKEIQTLRDSAMDSYKQVIAILPDSDLAYVYMGVVLDNQGRTQEAMTQFKHALQVNPQSVSAHNDLGNTLLNSGDTNGAMDEYHAALAIQPDNSTALNNLGTVYAQEKQWDPAIHLFTEALNANPKFTLARANLKNALIAKSNSR